MANDIILVDKNDKKIGVGEKMDVHQKGLLHQAFSIFIFNQFNELLIQKRANSKYHSGGMWSNSCCGHSTPNKSILDSAKNRLVEELSIKTDLEEIFTFSYKTSFDNGLYENEIDHVFMGFSKNDPIINNDEVSEFKWIDFNKLKKEMKNNPKIFTFWFLLLINDYSEELLLNRDKLSQKFR